MFVYDENDSAYTEPWLVRKLHELKMRKATPTVQLQVVHGGLYEEAGCDLQRQAA